MSSSSISTRQVPTTPIGQHRSLTAGGLAVLLVAYLPVNFAFGSVNVLAGDIGDDLSAGASGTQLVLSAYTATFAAALLVAGKLGDRFGRRRLITVGAVGTAVLNVAVACSPNLSVLIGTRILLGIAAGLLTPQILATIQATATGNRRTVGVMLFAAMSGGATVIGQLTAGGVTATAPEHLGWRIVQVIGGAFALIAVFGAQAIPESRAQVRSTLDPVGSVMIGAALLALVSSLTLGPSLGWPVWVAAILIVALVLLVVFWGLQVRFERRGQVPVVPPSVVKIPTVRRGLIMTLLFFITYGAMLYELSTVAVAQFGMGAAGAALLVVGLGVAFVLTSILLPKLNRTAGSGTMMIGALVQAVALIVTAVLIATGHGGIWMLQITLVPIGVAQSLMFGPLVGTVLSGASAHAAGAASGLISTSQQIGLSLGVTLLGGLFTTMSLGVGVGEAVLAIFAVHAVCALVFVALAHRLR